MTPWRSLGRVIRADALAPHRLRRVHAGGATIPQSSRLSNGLALQRLIGVGGARRVDANVSVEIFEG